MAADTSPAAKIVAQPGEGFRRIQPVVIAHQQKVLSARQPNRGAQVAIVAQVRRRARVNEPQFAGLQEGDQFVALAIGRAIVADAQFEVPERLGGIGAARLDQEIRAIILRDADREIRRFRHRRTFNPHHQAHRPRA
jgi:hypothetical protein